MPINKGKLQQHDAGVANRKGIFYVLLGAFFWGTLPIFSKYVYAYGSNPMTAAAWRSYLAAIIFFMWFLLDGTLKKFKLSNILYYLSMGIVAIGGTFILYMMAVEVLSTAMAAILLYTAPAFVILLNRLFFRESITKTKLIALTCTFIGCVLVTRAYDLSMLSANWKGIAIGLGAGLCYSLTTVIGSRFKDQFDGRARAGFMVMFSTTAFFFSVPPWKMSMPNQQQWIGYLGLALFGSVLAYVLYMKGLETGLDGGIASISATIEPVVATVLGVLFFSDSMEILQIIGILVVLTGVILPQVIACREYYVSKGEMFHG